MRHIGTGGFKHLFGPRGLALQTHSCSEYEMITPSSEFDLYTSKPPSFDSYGEELNMDDYNNDPQELRKTMRILRDKYRAAKVKGGNLYLRAIYTTSSLCVIIIIVIITIIIIDIIVVISSSFTYVYCFLCW